MFKIQAKDHVFLPLDHAKEKRWDGPFYFIQAADTQFGMEDKSIPDKTIKGCDPEIAWSTQMLSDLHKMTPPPRFLVICGDLLDAFPVQVETKEKEEREFKKIFSKVKIPLVCVCGNHDVGNQPTYESVSAYNNSFGDDYFSFWCGGVFFIVLNSQYYEDSSLVPKLHQSQEEWLESQLNIIKLERPEHVMVFQHIPYFLRDPFEGKDYFNIEINLRVKLLDRLYNSGIRYIFTGHYHRNAGGFYKDMELVVTSAVGKQLGDDDNGFRIVKVSKNKVEHKYYALGTAPTEVNL